MIPDDSKREVAVDSPGARTLAKLVGRIGE